MIDRILHRVLMFVTQNTEKRYRCPEGGYHNPIEVNDKIICDKCITEV